MIGGRRRSFASVDISSPLDAERQGEDLRRIVRVVVVRQAMTTLIDGKGFTDDAGKTLFSYAHRFGTCGTCRITTQMLFDMRERQRLLSRISLVRPMRRQRAIRSNLAERQHQGVR